MGHDWLQIDMIFRALLVALLLAILTPFTMVESVEDDILYAGTVGSPGKVLKIDLNTFQIVDRMSLNAGEDAHALDLDSEYLYVGTLTVPAKIIKIRLSDFKRINEITLPSEFKRIFSLHIFGDYLYVGLDSGQVARLEPSTLTLLGSIETQGNARDTIVIGPYLYVSIHAGPTDAYLQKLRVSDLSKVEGIQLSLEAAQFMLAVDSHLYVASNDAPAGLMKIDLNIFQEIASVKFLPDDKQGVADIVVRYGDYLLSNGDSFPGRLYRTRLSDFTWLDYIDLSEDRASDIEISGRYAYVSNVENPSSIIKVDLDDFREIAKIETGEGPAPQMVLWRAQQEPSDLEPKIFHIPVTVVVEGQPIPIYAVVTDDVAVTEAYLYYRNVGESSYTKLTMIRCTACIDTYNATIPAPVSEALAIEYYINASDGTNIATHPEADPVHSPHVISVDFYPTAVELGDPSDITEDSMRLTWTESIDDDFMNYTIYQSATLDTLGEPVAVIASRQTTSYTVTGLLSDTTYYFTVRTFDQNGLFADSDKVSGKTTSRTPSLALNLVLIVLVVAVIVAILLLKRK